jgi:UDP-2,3-diacylglucosamine hydrolase
MKAIFIADAHLRQVNSAGYKALALFLSRIRGWKGTVACAGLDKGAQGPAGESFFPEAPAIDRLYVVGDFFDFWFSRNGRIYPDFRPIVERLIDLRDQGVAISFYEGNHDFFLNDYFGFCLGMTVVPESGVLSLDGLRVFLAHGDMIDAENWGYLRLRRLLRSGLFYNMQKRLPLSLLWKAAQMSSLMSKELTGGSQDALVEKMEVFSMDKFAEGFDAVIMGHCHKPLLKEYVIDGRRKIFATLGDWIAHYSYLHYTDGRFQLANFRP